AVVNAVLLKPLPFPDAQRIIRVVRVQGSCTDCPISRPALFDWQQQSKPVFDAVGAFTGAAVTLTGDGDAEQLDANRVTAEFWDVFKVPALVGRTFTAEEDREDRALVVISHRFWQRHFDGDLGVVGKVIRLNGEAHEIIGVMPASFTYPGSDVLLPTHLAS